MASLDEAERAMRRVRLEVESLLSEARTVESELLEAKDRVRELPSKESLVLELAALKNVGQELSSQAANLELPIQDSHLESEVLATSKVIVARLGSALPIRSVESLILAAPVVTDPQGREALTAFALMAKKRLAVVADFTSWSWIAPAPAGEGEEPAWRNYMASGTLKRSQDGSQDGSLSWPASFLGPLPALAPSDGNHGINIKAKPKASYLQPDPSKFSFLGKMGFVTGLAKLPLNYPTGPALRAFGDSGPFCPASALASVRLAVEASRKADASGEKADIYVMTASKAQAALARSLLRDFGCPKRIIAGEPQDFELWPQAAMVILDTALAPPQASNSLSSAEIGRPSTLRAISLAAGALVVCASPASIESLPPKSILHKLWSGLADSAWPGWLPLQSPPFWEALDQAKNEALIVLPPFEEDWWAPLSGHFMSALRRKVKITVIAELPGEGARKYPGQAIRELRLFGANVVLAKGFCDFLTMVDGRHFSLGAPGGQASQKRWPFLLSLDLPLTVPLIMSLFQYQTLQAKLGPGGLNNCPLCGWPYLLVNQGRPRDFDYRQALRLGCLNPSCANHKRPRRLDERWPFTNPPTCPSDGLVTYELRATGRYNNWVCPKHGPNCPTYRHVPGDCPNYRP
jgi:hypothetical protein